MRDKVNLTNTILWAVFLALLAALLPHTYWFFSRGEQTGTTWLNVDWGKATALALAFAFEAAIAVLVHRLARHMETVRTPAGRLPLWVRRLWVRYANIYSLGLVFVVPVSAVANYTHAVEFAAPIKAFAHLPMSAEVYAVIAGAILPFCSLLFARVLANVTDTADEADPATVQLRKDIAALRKEKRAAEVEAQRAEARAARTEAKLKEYEALAKQVRALRSETKRDRILAAAGLNLALTNSQIAALTNAGLSYVGEVLSSANGDVKI